MEVRFEVSEPLHEEELRSLYRWLTDDRSLRGGARIERVAAPAVGQMGSDLEAVLAVLTTAAALAQIPFSFAAWRQSRRNRPVEVVVRVVGGDPAESERLLRALGQSSGPPRPERGSSPGTPEPDGPREPGGPHGSGQAREPAQSDENGAAPDVET